MANTKKEVLVGVREGAGPPPGYKWNAHYLRQSRESAMKILDETQYHHLVDQIKDLARSDDPTHSETVDVKPIEDFHELGDKGGPLGKLNMRVYFGVYKKSRTIMVFETLKKEDEGQLNSRDRVRIRRRKRAWEEKNGERT